MVKYHKKLNCRLIHQAKIQLFGTKKIKLPLNTSNDSLTFWDTFSSKRDNVLMVEYIGLAKCVPRKGRGPHPERGEMYLYAPRGFPPEPLLLPSAGTRAPDAASRRYGAFGLTPDQYACRRGNPPGPCASKREDAVIKFQTLQTLKPPKKPQGGGFPFPYPVPSPFLGYLFVLSESSGHP